MKQRFTLTSPLTIATPLLSNTDASRGVGERGETIVSVLPSTAEELVVAIARRDPSNLLLSRSGAAGAWGHDDSTWHKQQIQHGNIG
jgi:hypothetical protein